MLDAALTLASRGIAVFPLRPLGKKPYPGTRGFLDASTDPILIRKWWDIAPTSNVGGAVPLGVLIVDVDPRHNGIETLRALEAEGRSLPDTLTARTGGGGCHAWYSVPHQLDFPAQLGQGIDLKTGGRGYVVLPPSVHENGRRYEWIDERPIASAPAWLIAFGRPSGESAAVQVVDEDERVADDDALDAIVASIEPHFVDGKKHNIAKNLGGWMKQRGYGPGDVAYVVERLPSRDPRSRVRASIAAFGIEKPFGWHELRALIGEAPTAALDAATPNPRYQQALEERSEGEALAQAMAAAVAESEPAPAPIPASGMLARLRALQTQGPARATGFPSLDRALRGGLRDEKIMVVGGAPSSGKTSMTRQIVDYLCRSGVAVGWLASDEEPSAIDVRRLQAIGVPRHVAEQPDDATIERAARELAPLPFEIFDGAEGWTLERVFAELARRYPNSSRCVVADSLQTVRTERTTTLDSMRARIDDVITTAKLLSRAPATRAIVIFTSELARGSYRSEATADAINDLAAFKESGGIEYGAHVLLVLRSVKGDGQFVEVAMPKNRLGSKIDFTLKIDYATTNLVESFEKPRDSEQGNAAPRPASQETLAAASARVLAWLRANAPGGQSARCEALLRSVELGGAGGKKLTNLAAIDRLVRNGQVTVAGAPKMISLVADEDVDDEGEFASTHADAPPLAKSQDELESALYTQGEP